MREEKKNILVLVLKESAFLFFFTCFVTGCASLEGFRKDFHKQLGEDATVGGQWPEGAFLGEGRREVASTEQVPAENVSIKSTLKRKGFKRIQKEDLLDKTQAEGSLWATNGRTNYFFTENKIKNPGDLVTLSLDESVVRDIASEVLRSLNKDEIEFELEEAKKRLLKQKQTQKKGGRKAQAEEEEIEVPEPTISDIDLSGALGLKPGENWLAQVRKRFSNGNYEIETKKRLFYRGQPKWMWLIGIARGDDVEKGAKIKVSQLYEYRIRTDF